MRALCPLSLALCLGAAPTSALAKDPLELATQLAGAGEHTLCALEALRVGVDLPQLRPEALATAASCLGEGGEFSPAAHLWEELLALTPSEELRARASFGLCQAELALGEGLPRCAALGEDAPPQARYVLIQAALLADPEEVDLGEALSSQDGTVAAWAREDLAFQAEWRALDRCRPAVAGALSAVVPGLGRGYCGRWADGAMTLLLVGAPATASTLLWRQEGDPDVLFYLSAGTAAGMYLGNVYGAAVGARVQAAQAEAALRRAALDRMLARRGSVVPAPPG